MVGPKSNDWYHYKRNFDTERMPRDRDKDKDRDKDYSDAPTNQECQGLPASTRREKTGTDQLFSDPPGILPCQQPDHGLLVSGL